MTRMPEAAPNPTEIPDVVPAFFRLGPVNNSRVRDVLHQIQKNGMEDPRSTHQLLSLFQPESFTDDAFHVLSANTEPKTLWDQVAEAASSPGKLTVDQKGALTSLKYFALQSLAEDPQEHVMHGGQTRVLHESVRDAVKTELNQYDAYLANTLDPEDFASARFFDRAKVVGRVAGRTAEAGGTAYLILNLFGCSFGVGAIPSPSPEPSPSGPRVTIVAPLPTVTQPEFGVTPTNIPVPDTLVDEIGAPTSVHQFEGDPTLLQPMIDALTKQLGFTPAQGELAGFTVVGAKGEETYFVVSHDGAVYTIFAHAGAGQFSTVKTEGADKTTDFAIFKMLGVTRDATDVWWGIDDGHGGLIEPMFKFVLNPDGSVNSVFLVEQKSGKEIQIEGGQAPQIQGIILKADFLFAPRPIPALPAEFLSKVPSEAYSYNASGLQITLDNGLRMDISPAEIADRLKSGEGGTPLILGDLLANPTEVSARSVSAYFDGTKWVAPEVWRNMRYTPELMIIKGESIPAVIEAVTVTEDQSNELVSKIPGELITSTDEVISTGAGDIQHMALDNLVLAQRTTEKITTFPGVATKEKAMYQTYFNYIYLAGGNIHRVQILAKGRFSSHGYGENREIITNDSTNSYYEIGKSYYLSFTFPVSTSPFDEGKCLAYSQTDYPNPGIDTYFAYWGIGSELYTFDQIKTTLETSSGVVSFEKFLIGEITKHHY